MSPVEGSSMDNRTKHCGFTIVEVAAGTAMLAVLLTLVGQMLVATRHSARVADQSARWLQVVDNALEEFVAAPWAEIDQESVAKLKLSDDVRRRWPLARLSGTVTASTEPLEAKQVTLRLSLGSDSPDRPVSLTTWVYRKMEAPR